MKSLQEVEKYFLFIAEQLYKLDYQHQKNIINIVKKFETHKSRSQLVTDIENDIKDTGVALKSLLSIYLKNVYLDPWLLKHRKRANQPLNKQNQWKHKFPFVISQLRWLHLPQS